MTELKRAKLWRQAYRNELALLDDAITAARIRLADLEDHRAHIVKSLGHYTEVIERAETEGDPPC
jgi:hypothetical protein